MTMTEQTETRADVRTILAKSIRCHDMNADDRGYAADEIMDALEAAGLVIVDAATIAALQERIRVLEAFVVAYDDQQDWWCEGPETTTGEDGPDSWTDASVRRQIDTQTAVELARAAVGELEGTP